MILQDIAVHTLASSVTVSAHALREHDLHIICIFGLTSVYMESDSLRKSGGIVKG